MSQAEFADVCGASAAQIGFWERGISEPSLAHVVAMCSSLGMSAHWLVLGRGVFAAAEIPDPVDEASGLSESQSLGVASRLRDADLLYLLKRRPGIQAAVDGPRVLQVREPPVQREGYVEEVVREYEVRPVKQGKGAAKKRRRSS